MEFVLNLGWLLLVLFMTWQWARYARGTKADWRMQLVALAVVAIILLPAISVTDDLIAASNPAEVDTCLRRDHDRVNPHAMLSAMAALEVSPFAGLSLGAARIAVAANPPACVPDNPALFSIDNRPPPTA